MQNDIRKDIREVPVQNEINAPNMSAAHFTLKALKTHV